MKKLLIRTFLNLNILTKSVLRFILFIYVCNSICFNQNNSVLASGKIYSKNDNNVNKKLDKLNRLRIHPYYADHKIYNEKEILDFEKKTHIKLPVLAKNIYTGKINIRELILYNKNNLKLYIQKIFDLEKIEEDFFTHNKRSNPSYIEPPSKRAVICGYDCFGELVYFDDDCIWLYSHEAVYCEFEKFTTNR